MSHQGPDMASLESMASSAVFPDISKIGSPAIHVGEDDFSTMHMHGIADTKAPFSAPSMTSEGMSRKRIRVDQNGPSEGLQGGPGHLVSTMWPSTGAPMAMDQQANIGWCDSTFQRLHKVFDEDMNEIQTFHLHCDVDKGFKSSPENNGYICQKKNHFQVSIVLSTPKKVGYVSTESGMLKVKELVLDLHGVKFEDTSYHIQLEQSMSDRSKQAFGSVALDQSQITAENSNIKTKVCRLHFTETTANNMRKRGKPNPEQKYFCLVVEVRAKVSEKLSFVVASRISDQIIVRASNPGQFEMQPTVQWSQGMAPNSVFHMGMVGINNDCPDEALCLNGNLAMTGTLMQPSDRRVKQDIVPCDNKQQLDNIRALKLYKYNLKDAWADSVGVPRADARQHTGVLAQELQKVMPDAVKQTGNRTLNDGTVIEDLLVVNKDRLMMEGIGALKELAAQQENLEALLAQAEASKNRANEKQPASPSKLKKRTSKSTLGEYNGATEPTSSSPVTALDTMVAAFKSVMLLFQQ
eukprot:m.631042 g.631042  ORF g.631042 m.631042 type:complete len:523 (-) comp22570_c0_seq1:395-1963(-)